MKFITERTEIAKAMNFGKYPVVELNIGKNYKDYENLFKGSEVIVDCPTRSHGVLPAYCELVFEKTEETPFPSRIDLMQGSSCLKASFGYSDVMEMLENANKPHLQAGQEVVVVLNNPEAKACMVAMYKVSERVDLHCQTVATLEEMF